MINQPGAQAQPRVVLLIPCLNEELTIGKVIDDFRRELPQATIIVYDNASTDQTAAVAREHGAIVRSEKRRGKGYVVNRIMSEEEGDFLIMVDGDDTYEASGVSTMLAPLIAGAADMVVGVRQTKSDGAYRPFHVFGNQLVNRLVGAIYGCPVSDVMSGYRAFTHEVARSLPVVSTGFEIETEMMLQLLARGHVVAEVPVQYRERPHGSFSKLRTVRDGFRVLLTILGIAKSAKPLTFFGLIATAFTLVGVPVLAFGLKRSLVDGVELATSVWLGGFSCMILAFICVGLGATLHSINSRFAELTDLIRKK